MKHAKTLAATFKKDEYCDGAVTYKSTYHFPMQFKYVE